MKRSRTVSDISFNTIYHTVDCGVSFDTLQFKYDFSFRGSLLDASVFEEVDVVRCEQIISTNQEVRVVLELNREHNVNDIGQCIEALSKQSSSRAIVLLGRGVQAVLDEHEVLSQQPQPKKQESVPKTAASSTERAACVSELLQHIQKIERELGAAQATMQNAARQHADEISRGREEHKKTALERDERAAQLAKLERELKNRDEELAFARAALLETRNEVREIRTLHNKQANELRVAHQENGKLMQCIESNVTPKKTT